MCPGNHESAGKRRSGKARKGNAALRSALIEAAWSASHSRDSYYAAQYRRFCRRFGKRSESKAIFVVAHSMLVAIWHILANDCDYEDLGSDWFERHATPSSMSGDWPTRSNDSATRSPSSPPPPEPPNHRDFVSAGLRPAPRTGAPTCSDNSSHSHLRVSPVGFRGRPRQAFLQGVHCAGRRTERITGFLLGGQWEFAVSPASHESAASAANQMAPGRFGVFPKFASRNRVVASRIIGATRTRSS